MKSQRWIPIWIGRATFLVGLFDILASIFRKFRAPVHKLDHVFPVFLNGSALATSIFTGLVLMILARGLSRRKRRAWILALIMLSANLVAEIFKANHHLAQISLSALSILALVIFRKSFYAKSDPSTRLQPIIGLVLP